MTTIVGIQGDGFAVVCADSRVSSMFSDGAQISTLGDGFSKIAVNGKYLLGAAGDVRAINILQHAFQPPAPPPSTTGKKLDQFFTVRFIPALRECFEAQGYATPERDDKEHIAEHSSTIIVAVNGVIYVVDGDYSWSSDSNAVYAIGSGASYALGAMQVLTRNKRENIQQAKNHALKALNAAARFDPHTGPPYHTHVQGRNGRIRKTV